jgi:hypothetical protein
MAAHREFKRTGKISSTAANELTGHFVAFPDKHVLSRDSWPQFKESARTYLTRFGGHTLLNLLDIDPRKQEAAVADCFALGRGDARALLMLRHLVERLSGPALHLAVKVLSYCTTYHPDIFWHEGNWIPQRTQKSVSSSFSWTPREIFHMIREVDARDDPWKWDRGTSGQCLLLLLLEDKDLGRKLPDAVRIACEANETQVAVIMLYVHQYRMAAESASKEDLLEEIEKIVAANPPLSDDRATRDLFATISDHGWADIF